MNHTGVVSTGWRLQAFRNLEFVTSGLDRDAQQLSRERHQLFDPDRLEAQFGAERLDFVPHVGRSTSDRGEHWELMAGPRSYMGTENIFTLGDVSIHITALDQTKCAGKVLDWKDGVGVFEGGTPIV